MAFAAVADLDSSSIRLEHLEQRYCWSPLDDGVPRSFDSEPVTHPSCVPTAVDQLLQTLGLHLSSCLMVTRGMDIGM